LIEVLRETHEAPATVAHRLARAGGRNIFGEPNFRAVWGWNRLGWIGGRWTDRDPATGSVLRETIAMRLAPKYFPLNRWHIERWCAPETYGSPEQWARNTLEIEDGRNVPALGPYPSRGEYEHVFTLEDPRGNFLQLTPTIAERLASMIERSRALSGACTAGLPPGALGLSRTQESRRGRESLYRREAHRDHEYDAWAEALLSG
jgi:hypothetical protein